MDWIKWSMGGVAMVLAIAGFVPYIVQVLNGRVKPHVFSWLIWGLTTTIVFFAQLQADGGIGAWPIGVSGFITLYVAFLAYLKRGDASSTVLDWWFLAAALASLPLWYLTQDPLWAVIILTVVDVLGFGPTARKAYHHPFEESRAFFLLIILRNACAIIALEAYSLATVLFPFVMALACVLLLAMMQYRRLRLAQSIVP